MIDFAHAFDLPPAEAVEFFRNKGYRLSWNWFDTHADVHARAFTVAKVARMDILESIRFEVDRAIADGQTAAEFRRRLEPRLKTLGWWGKKIVVGSNGGAEVVQEGNPWRLNTIYRVNTQSAYNAGRYTQQVASAEQRPYLMYVAVDDSRTRAAHRALNGRVWAVDDPMWSSHYPPNGWNCRCRVRALSAAKAQRLGVTPESSAGKLSTVEQALGTDKRTGVGHVAPGVRWYDPVTGQTMLPDPGWSHNPAGRELGDQLLQQRLERADPALREAVRRDGRSRELMDGLDRWESAVRYAQIEHGAILDRSSGVLLHTAVGSDVRVGFDPELLRQAAGQVLTHTHPVVTAFSEGDITNFLKYRISELRAVDERYRYSLRLRRALSDRERQELLDRWVRAEDAAMRDLGDIIAGGVDKSAAHAGIYHQVNLRAFGGSELVTYRREKW